MKNRFKSSFNLLVLFALLMMLFGVGPVESVQAEAAESPLAAGGDFVWAKGIGGAGGDQSSSVALDASGNIYATGHFEGVVDFDPDANVSNLTSAGSDDVFIYKMNSSGGLVWAKSIGGVNIDAGYAVSLDANGNIYTVGCFSGVVDFDPGAGVYNMTSSQSGAAFISKLDNNGNFVWAKSISGDNGAIEASSLAVDSSGNSYFTGLFSGTLDFDPGAGVYTLSTVDADGVTFTQTFVSKLNANGEFTWARQMQAASPKLEGAGVSPELPPINPDPYSLGNGIAVDTSGNVYTTGQFNYSVDFDPGAGTFVLTTPSGTDGYDVDIFISKLNGSGNFVWARNMGGTSWDNGNGITVDSTGNVYTTGSFVGPADFDPGAGVFNLISAGDYDIFVSKLNSQGNFVWAKSMGGVTGETGIEIALDSANNVYTTGHYGGTADFDPGTGVFNLTAAGLDDIFVSKLTGDGSFIWAKSMSGASIEHSTSLVVDANENVYTTGFFIDTVDFDPGAGTVNLISAGSYDAFVAKLSGGATSTFADVPFDHPMHDYIEALYDAGYTAGCSTSPLMFCPDTILDRAQSAVFMLRGQMGLDYIPPAAPWNTFVNESWVGFEWAQPWAEGMYQEGLTQGCQSNPLMYCPATQLPRVEASVFGLRMKYGVNYTPPAASGTLFADFPSTDPSYWAIDWAEQAYNDGLLPACGTDSATGKPMFCPSQLVDRGWGAYLIVKAKNLPLP